MPKLSLTDGERTYLQALNDLDDGEGAFTAWAPHLSAKIKELGRTPDMIEAAAVLGALRRRKLVDADGRGKFASYYINDKGKAALNG